MTRVFRGVAAALGLGWAAVAGVAHADYSFSASGSNGTLVGAGEGWTYAYNDVRRENAWISTATDGSPAGAQYYEPAQAYGLVLNFSGGSAIDAASIPEQTSPCYGDGGSTCFGVWKAVLLGPNSIEFLAQSPSDGLVESEYYYGTVLFKGAAPTSFTGAWLTSYAPTPAAPEPEAWALTTLGVGVAGAALRSRRSRVGLA